MIGGRGGGAPVSHINDAEVKIYEYLRANGLSRDAEGAVYIGTWRTRAGGTIFEPLPMCASCTNATWQMVGDFPGVTFGSLTTPYPGLVVDLDALLAGKASLP
jgi:hypothetical protein